MTERCSPPRTGSLGDDLAGVREFFGPRAAGWDAKFPNDGPRFARAIVELAPPAGGRVLDAACGTGRALPFLRHAVGASGIVLGLDVTVEMLAQAERPAVDADTRLLFADVNALPITTGSLDAVFAAGLVRHLREPVEGLGELARVCRPGGGLALFHPVGRASLAHRHGRELDREDILSPRRVGAVLAQAGWRLTSVDDAADRYLALAVRID